MRKWFLARWRVCAQAALILTVVLLTACANSNTPAPVVNSWNRLGSSQQVYVVQDGDTLYSIAWRFNVSDQKLAAYNKLAAPYVVKPGQKIRLIPSQKKPLAAKVKPVVASPKVSTVTDNAPPAPSQNMAASPASGKGHMPWPLKGKVIGQYGQNGNKGIDIAVPQGTEVKAVDAGTVVYSGSNLHGYGQLIIIKHDNNLMTAYAHNSKLLLKEGASVSNGQVIAASGHSEAAQDMLHFEVRQNGKPVNPMNFLN